MKGIIVGVCAFAIKTNSQFNFDISGAGVSFGILGNEVFSVGNQNKSPSYSNSNNLNMPNIPIPSIDVPSPFPLFTTVQTTFQGEPQIQTQSNIIQPPKDMVINPQASKVAIQQEKPQDKKQIEEEEIKQVKHQQKITIKETKSQQLKLDIIKNGQKIVIDVSGEKEIEKESQSEQIRDLKQKQDQRLAKFIHLMPQSEKNHLRAIASNRSPN